MCYCGAKWQGGTMCPKKIHFFTIYKASASKITLVEFKKGHIPMQNLISDWLEPFPGR